MSSHVLLTHPAPCRARRPRSLLDRLLPARNAPALPVGEMQALSDRLLVDIGIDPRSVPRPAQEQAVRLGLLDCGWQFRRR